MSNRAYAASHHPCPKVRGLNWQSIFRPATLLCRLPVEPPSLQLRIARLLLPLHLPAGSSSPSQLEKLVELCVGKRAAAAALLKHLPKLATPAAVVKVRWRGIGAKE
eukprot:scaffold281197_cov33-Tisochrysis_lutea.AAC.3